jgi:hypothetical protein
VSIKSAKSTLIFILVLGPGLEVSRKGGNGKFPERFLQQTGVFPLLKSGKNCLFSSTGEVAERSNAAVSKSETGRF